MKPIFYCQTTSAHQEMISSLQLNPFSCALSVVFKCFRHTVSSCWKSHECYLLFMPSELLLIILWQCLEGLNKISTISSSQRPGRVSTSKAEICCFWAQNTSPFRTLVRPKYVWKLLPTSAILVSTGRRIWCGGQTEAIAQPSQAPKMCTCRSQCWSDTTWLLTSVPTWLGMRLPRRENELND